MSSEILWVYKIEAPLITNAIFSRLVSTYENILTMKHKSKNTYVFCVRSQDISDGLIELLDAKIIEASRYDHPEQILQQLRINK